MKVIVASVGCASSSASARWWRTSSAHSIGREPAKARRSMRVVVLTEASAGTTARELARPGVRIARGSLALFPDGLTFTPAWARATRRVAAGSGT